MAQEAHFEIPTDMHAFAEKSVEQARKAFDTFVSAAYGTATAFEGRAAAVRKGSEDLRQRAMAFAEQNVASSFDFANRLVNARDLPEIIHVQSEYVKAQMQVLAEQARELGETASQTARNATKSQQ
ncbi:MAG: phasin family protein [Xanthobacteraceae bacterium]